MKPLAILGSTGSIGRNTLHIVKMFPDRFRVKTLAAATNVALLAQQVEAFDPEIAVVIDAERADELARRLHRKTRVNILFGPEGYKAAATHPSVEMVVTAVVGAAGLLPTLAAIESGKDVALANKETLVMAGEIVIKRAAEKNVRILPVDSEHSAIFQCLSGQRKQDLQKIYLTASGGPFLDKPVREFAGITPDEALQHPTWQMGRKITIDSATLMNKGLEVIEARHLFGVSADRIEVLIHPQSFIHSMVAFCDGSVMAQIGIPDMKAAIAYGISYPERLPLKQPVPDFVSIGSMVFRPLEAGKFQCLELAFDACRRGGTLPAVLNAANEVAVQAFLNRQIPFTGIWQLIKDAMLDHERIEAPDLAEILAADKWARNYTVGAIERFAP